MRYICCFCAVLLFVPTSLATVVHVPSQQPTIQAGIDAVVDGDTVEVAAGAYAEHVVFGYKSVLLLAPDGPDQTSITKTTPGVALISFPSYKANTSRIEGFSFFGSVTKSAIVVSIGNSPKIIGCKFLNNSAAVGGGIQCTGNTTLIRRCVFQDNYSADKGGGILIAANSVKVDSCVFYSNHADEGGGAMSITYSQNVEVLHNLVYDNEVVDDWGGVVYAENSSDLKFINNTIVDNSSTGSGAGLTIVTGNTVEIRNNIIAFNETGYGLLVTATSSNVTCEYNDLFSNQGGNYSGVTPGVGCLALDPMFRDPVSWDYNLTGASPCINTGDPDPQYNDPNGTRNDIGALQFSSAVAILDIPDQSIHEGASFPSIILDDFVTDEFYADSTIDWDVSGQSELSVSIDAARVATVDVPDTDWFGQEVVTFTATNPAGDYDSDTVTFEVLNVNDPPVALDDVLSVAEESALSVFLPYLDIDSDTLEFALLAPPANGLITYFDSTSGEGIYVPSVDFNGWDTLTFTLTDDSLAQSNVGIIEIEVTPINDAPAFSSIPDQVVYEGSPFQALFLDNYVTDVDNGPEELAWTYIAGNELLLEIDEYDSIHVTALNEDWFGSDTIGFIATDPGGLADTQEVIYQVVGVNDAPQVSGIPDQTVRHHRAFAEISLDDYVSDADGEVAGLDWTHSGNTSLTVAIDGNHVASISTPSDDWTGTDTVIFTVTDSALASDEDTIALTILENVPPEPPVLLSPINDDLVDTLRPQLVLRNVYDEDEDSLIYTFQVAMSPGFSFPEQFHQEADDDSITKAIVPQALEENKRYWWRAKSSDYYDESPFTSAQAFYVNSLNELPTSCSLLAPGSITGGEVMTQSPEFVWTLSTDIDPLDQVSYSLYVAIDSNFSFVEITPGLSDTSFVLDYSLDWDLDYWWKVKTEDLHGGLTWSSQVFTFSTQSWVCGDADGNAIVNISDAVYLITYIFGGGPPPDPMAAGDADMNGIVNISDAVYLITYIFGGGPAPCEGN